MDSYILLLAATGILILALAGLPSVVRRLPLSTPVVLVTTGGLLTLIAGNDVLPAPNEYPHETERLTEFVVIVSLMAAGLKLDTPVGWRRWALTWRLLAITMPLSIAMIALLGWSLLGMAPATAMLLGAVLAPTDPVLAADVQVGPPGESGEEGRVRFALTSEAGLNDALAFPFVNLAIGMAAHQGASLAWLGEWLAVDVVWKLAAGLVVGWAAGRLAAWLLFRLPPGARLAGSDDGFVVVGLTLLAYGATELLHGYGFLGVFVAALTLRAAERGHHYHRRLHAFAEEIERLSMAALLLCVGASFVAVFLGQLTPLVLGAALLILLIVRPLAGIIGLVGSAESRAERLAVGFFGIRGVGSFYYLAYAVTAASFADEHLLWATVTTIVVLSILLHGVTATPAMRRVGRSAAP